MYKLRLLERHDWPAWMALHDRPPVHNDTHRVGTDEASFAQIVAGAGFIIGAFIDEDLAGYASLKYLEPDEQIIGKSAGIAEFELPFVAQAAGAMVNAEYRGLGLHKKMAAIRAQTARDLGLRHLICEVHGSDTSNLHKLFELGFKVRGTTSADNEPLLILHCNLTNHDRPIKFEAEVKANDTPQHKALLAHGHVGYCLTATQEGHYVKYGRLLKEPGDALPLPPRARPYRLAAR